MLDDLPSLFTNMTLPMVTCPLCCQPGFSTSDALCSALINVTTRKLCCPICNCVVIGLDKFTIHLFTHSLNKYGIEQRKDSIEICHSDENMAAVKRIPGIEQVGLELINSHNMNNSIVKFENNLNQDISPKISDKLTLQVNSNLAQHELQKSFSDTSLICFRADNGQLFTIATDGLGPTLKNVTINTQNYITNTNITTSTVQTTVQKRKYSQVFERENTESKIYEQESPENYSNVESVNSWPSTPSVSSETDKQSNNNLSEREFESCKDLLTKGDFSTLTDDMNEFEVRKEGNYSDNFGNETIADDTNDRKDDSKKKIGLSCELCPYVFPNKTILAMHKQLIHKKVEVDLENKRKLLVCSLCPRTFNLRSSLMIHRRVAHAGGFGNAENGSNSKPPATKPACHVCGKFFKKEIHLTQHMKAHDEKQWQCTICSKTFTTKYFLKKHRRLHTGETPYKCTTCGKCFTFQQSYHKHLLYHNDEKPYCCAQCGRLFKELSTLHNHERIHSGEKPFSCETCGKSFRQRVSYLVHRRIHTGVMPYQCTACNKKFRYKISQRTHKCTVNPPGVVVRTNGSLVERLQAAMVKAAGDSDKKAISNEMAAETYPPNLSESETSFKSPVRRTSTLLSLSNDQMDSSCSNENKTEDQYTETSSIEKTAVDKPQIYLLVKGPNEETYYQPLMLSQNSNIVVNQNTSSVQKYKIKESECKYPEKSSATNKENSSLEVSSADEILTNPVDSTTSMLDEKVSSDPMRSDHKVEKCSEILKEKNKNELHMKNGYHWLINEKKFDNITCEPIMEMNEITANILSDDTTMNEIITSLTKEFSETQNNSNVLKDSSSKSDTIMMDSNDIFSLILSPTLSSPSECFGRLSLSPSTSTMHTSNDNFDSSQMLADNFNNINDEHQDHLFDSISDDALKEFLFGSSK